MTRSLTAGRAVVRRAQAEDQLERIAGVGWRQRPGLGCNRGLQRVQQLALDVDELGGIDEFLGLALLAGGGQLQDLRRVAVELSWRS